MSSNPARRVEAHSPDARTREITPSRAHRNPPRCSTSRRSRAARWRVLMYDEEESHACVYDDLSKQAAGTASCRSCCGAARPGGVPGATCSNLHSRLLSGGKLSDPMGAGRSPPSHHRDARRATSPPTSPRTSSRSPTARFFSRPTCSTRTCGRRSPGDFGVALRGQRRRSRP